MNAPTALAVPAALLLLAGAVFVGHQLSLTYSWVELDGAVVRGRKFWSRRLVEQRVEDVDHVVPLYAVARHAAENQIIEALWGTTNRGYEIRFRDGPKVVLIRGDMIDVDGFIAALRDRIGVRWAQVSA